QMPANAIGEGLIGFVNHAAEHGYMLAQVAADQAAVDVPQHIGGLETNRSLLLQLALLVQQAGGHELEQHGDKGRGRAVAGYVRQIEGQLGFRDAEVIDEVTGQVKRWDDAMLEQVLTALPG